MSAKGPKAIGGRSAQDNQKGIEEDGEGKLLVLAEEARQGSESKQLLKRVSCRECQGDMSALHCNVTRRCSGLTDETSMSGGPQLMTPQLRSGHWWKCSKPGA